MHGEINNEMASLAVAGIAIVFGVLAVIAMVVGLLKKLDERWQKAEARVAAEAIDQPQDIDETTLILIATAAAVAAGGRFRVRRIRRLLSPRTKRTPWSAQGRLILQGSHMPRRKRDMR